MFYHCCGIGSGNIINDSIIIVVVIIIMSVFSHQNNQMWRKYISDLEGVRDLLIIIAVHFTD